MRSHGLVASAFTTSFFVVMSLAVAACSKSDSASPTAAATVASPAASASAAANHPVIAPPAPTPSASASSDAAREAHGTFANVPATRSKVPTVAEWGAAKDIKDVPGNGGDLSECEVRNVREWLRISCRAFGGMQTGTALPRVVPQSATIEKGKDGETFSFAQGDVASIVWPMVDGKSREAKIGYGDAFPAKTITLDFPHGAPAATLRFSK